MPVDRVREILKIAQEPVSLETPIGEEEDSHLGDFIPDEDETAYWDDDHPRWEDVRLKAHNNFIGHAYEKPNRLRAQVFTRVYFRYQEGRSMCKKFLIMLAAINHTLLCREGTSSAQESPSQTAARYAEERYFSLENEVR